MSEDLFAPTTISMTHLETSNKQQQIEKACRQGQIMGALLADEKLGQPWSTTDQDFYRLSALIELGLAKP